MPPLVMTISTFSIPMSNLGKTSRNPFLNSRYESRNLPHSTVPIAAVRPQGNTLSVVYRNDRFRLISTLTEWLNCASVEMTLLFSLIFGWWIISADAIIATEPEVLTTPREQPLRTTQRKIH